MPAFIRRTLACSKPPGSLFVSASFPPIRHRECEGEVTASRVTPSTDEKSRAQDQTATHTGHTKPHTRKCPQSHGELPVRRLQTQAGESPEDSRSPRIHASPTYRRPGRTKEHETRPGERGLFHPVSRKGVFPREGRSESRQHIVFLDEKRPQQITTAGVVFDRETGAANHDSIVMGAANHDSQSELAGLAGSGGDRFARTDGRLVAQREQRGHEDERSGDAGDLADQRGLAEAANGHVLADEE